MKGKRANLQKGWNQANLGRFPLAWGRWYCYSLLLAVKAVEVISNSIPIRINRIYSFSKNLKFLANLSLCKLLASQDWKYNCGINSHISLLWGCFLNKFVYFSDCTSNGVWLFRSRFKDIQQITWIFPIGIPISKSLSSGSYSKRGRIAVFSVK